MATAFETAKETSDKFDKSVMKYLSENELSKLPSFNKLQTKETIGEIYRNDQSHFEKVSGLKAKYFSLISYFTALKLDNMDRVERTKIDSYIDYLSKQISAVDVYVSQAKQRVKFLESVIYLVSNMTYGDY